MVDYLELEVIGGRGGDGAVSFHREKFVRRGPPDGGDGGDGGNVYVIGDRNLLTLYDLASRKRYQARNGKRGGRSTQRGKGGEDLYLKVPLGTLVSRITKEGPRLIGEITNDEDTLLVARGGKGGKGNARFKSSTNRSPKEAEVGEEGERVRVSLELKIIADIGLVGLPNAGKSTLLNAITNAQSRVAQYPFTTLDPQLGVLTMEGAGSDAGGQLVIADVPGLIEGASRGKGLGDQFLRHIERTRVLVHLIDPTTSSDLWGDYQTIRDELAEYSPQLLLKQELVVLTKGDLECDEVARREIRSLQKRLREYGTPSIYISALENKGLEELVVNLVELVRNAPQEETVNTARRQSAVTYTIDNLPNQRMVFKKNSP